MRKIIKKIIPNFILKYLYHFMYWHKVRIFAKNGLKRYAKYSAKFNDKDSMQSMLLNTSHSIEKGFAMPNFRYGFGELKMAYLLDLFEKYISIYGYDNVVLDKVRNVLFQYYTIHKSNNYSLPNGVYFRIEKILSLNNIKGELPKEVTLSDFFSKKDSSFPIFSNSRRSCRNFSTEKIPLDIYQKAIELANNYPSACNRQPCRVYIVQDQTKIGEVFSLHGGNRGFGHNVTTLLVITSFLGGYSMDRELNCAFVDGGIYTMNLTYALHYCEVGCCILNWSVDVKKDKLMRQYLPIKDNEAIVTLLACGKPVEEFVLCDSGKRNINDIITVI